MQGLTLVSASLSPSVASRIFFLSDHSRAIKISDLAGPKHRFSIHCLVRFSCPRIARRTRPGVRNGGRQSFAGHFGGQKTCAGRNAGLQHTLKAGRSSASDAVTNEDMELIGFQPGFIRVIITLYYQKDHLIS